jgi:hypothetical protein
MQSLVRIIDKACGYAYSNLPEGTNLLDSVFQFGSSAKMTSAVPYEGESQISERPH